MANKIIHKHSAVVNGNVAKLPSPEMLEYGELAVNYAAGNETVSFKNNNDEIVTIRTNEYLTEIIEENELITAEALINLDNRVIDLENAPDPETYFVLNTSYMQDEESSAAVFASLEEAYYAGKMIVLANTADGSEFVLPTTVSKEDDGTFVFMVSTVDCTAASANLTTLYYIISPTGVEVSEDSSSMSLLKDGEGNKFLNDRGEYSEIVIDQELSTTSENPISNKAVATTISNVEHVVASALTDLDGRIIELEAEPSVTKVSDLINDLGFITAEDALPAQTYLEVTHQELVDLKNSSQLIPGTKYRITDYVTKYQVRDIVSMEKPFDLIVTAIDVNVLDSKANAVQHAGETYFAACDMSKWELWYDLEKNAPKRIVMDGELLLNEPVTFNLSYITEKIMFENVEYHAYEGVLDGVLIYVLSDSEITDVNQEYKIVGINPENKEMMEIPLQLPIVEISQGGGNTGFIYRMIDEYLNDCPYDFKNLKKGDGTYTFSYSSSDDTILDASLTGIAYSNKISGTHKIDGSILYNTFSINGLDSFIAFNEIGEDSKYNTITSAIKCGATNVKIGNSSSNNTISIYTHASQSVLCGEYANITIGNLCNNNNISGYDITIGDNSSDNDLDRVAQLTIGKFANENHATIASMTHIGDNCCRNTIYSYTGNNIIDHNSSDNAIGQRSHFNLITSESNGNDVKGSNNKLFGASSNIISGVNNVFEAGADNNVIYGSYNTFKQNAMYNQVKREFENAAYRNQVNWVTFDENCSYNVLWNEGYDPEADSEDRYDDYRIQNVHVLKGVCGTSTSYNSIRIPYLNAEYEVKVAKNSAGEINVYCEEDRIAALEAALANAALVAKVSASEYQEMVNNGTANDEYLYVITEDDTTEA